MQLTFIEFKNLKLDFSNNYYQSISFNYKSDSYNFSLYPKGDSIYIYQPNLVAAKVAVNKIIKTTNIDITFCHNEQSDYVVPRSEMRRINGVKEITLSQYGFKDDKDLSIETIFIKYKLGVISYV